MSEWYWLVDGKVVPAPVGRYLQPQDNRVVASTHLGDGETEPWISTVFLGLDHGWGDGPPIVFETMVFWGSNEALDNECERYSALEEALAGHERWVEKVRFVRSAGFAGIEPAARPGAGEDVNDA